MKELLEYLLEKTVPDTKIEVDEKEEDGFITLTIFAPQEYIGKIIGKGGKNINALKNVIKIRAIKEDKKVEVNVVEKE